MREAMFYQREGNRVRCELCRFRCLIDHGKRGICGVRENREGTLYSLVYGKVCAEQVDPIEKKPLFHVMPGSMSYSIATQGCNFRCRHCQNYSISQVDHSAPIRGPQQTPQEIVHSARSHGCRSISYTYTEPTMFFEFAYDTARLAHEAGLANVFVTNGYISRAPLEMIAPYLQAANIDLKGFSERFYRDIVQARLSEVLDSILTYAALGIWLEITTLIIPGLNDSEQELEGIASFIATNLGPDTPWHVSQFYPTYQLNDISRTPPATLAKARDIGIKAGLRYVYEGNVPGMGGENTSCSNCSATLIERHGFRITRNRINKGGCPQCGTAVAGIGM